MSSVNIRMERSTKGREWTIRESVSRSPSPPPPPPPPLDSSSIILNPFDEGPPQKDSPPKSARSGPFPFLKKNSRKEPSAVHKKSPSPTKRAEVDSSEKKNTGSNRKVKNATDVEKPLDKFDVLLSGKDYWGLDSSIVDDIRAEVGNQGSGLPSYHDSSYKTSNYSKTDDDLGQHKQQITSDLLEFEQLEQAIAQESNPNKSTQKGSEYHLAKALDKSNSATSQFVKMAQASSVHSHSRLLAQTLARSKSGDERKSIGASSSAFGYKRAEDEDDNDDEDVDIVHRRFGMTGRSSAGGMSQQPSTMSHRPAPIIPTKTTYEEDDDFDEDTLYNQNNKDTRFAETVADSHRIEEDGGTDLSFNFEDLPLPTVTAGKSHAPQPPYAIYAAPNQTSQNLRHTNSNSKIANPSKLERPASTLTVDHPSATTNRQGRARTPTNSAQQRNRSLSTGRGQGKATSSASVVSQNTGDMSKEMEEKMRSLEKELEHYKAENASIKKFKKQQESALAETVQRKEEVLRYLEEERQRTLAWCAEQRAEAEKEKRAAAKQIREAKQKTLGTTAPVKLQKAEIEALQATIEKLKSSHEAAAKKWKTTENRLYALIHEHSDHVENLEKQLLVLEENRISLLEFIAQAGLRLPKSLQTKVISDLSNPTIVSNATKTSSKAGTAASSATATPSGRISAAAARQQALQQTLQKIQHQQEKEAHKGYVEEVDVEVIEISSPTPPVSKPQQSQGINSNPSTRRSSTSSNTTTTSSSSLAGRHPHKLPQNHHSSLPGVTQGLSMNEHTMRQVTSSWARSSRSSGRYSQTSDDLEDFFDDDEDGAHHTRDNRLKESAEANLLDFDDESTANQQHYNSSGNNGSTNRGMADTRHAIDDAFADLLPATATPSVPSSSAVSSKKSPIGGNNMNEVNGHNNNRVEEVRPDGTKTIRYRNGTIKEVDLVGNQKVYFANGDKKFTDLQSNTVIYFYAENQTTHTTYADGVELFEFPNGQLERHYPTGKKEVVFPDRSKKIIHSDGLQESIFPDGVRLLEYADGRREVLRPDDAHEVF